MLLTRRHWNALIVSAPKIYVCVCVSLSPSSNIPGPIVLCSPHILHQQHTKNSSTQAAYQPRTRAYYCPRATYNISGDCFQLQITVQQTKNKNTNRTKAETVDIANARVHVTYLRIYWRLMVGCEYVYAECTRRVRSIQHRYCTRHPHFHGEKTHSGQLYTNTHTLCDANRRDELREVLECELVIARRLMCTFAHHHQWQKLYMCDRIAIALGDRRWTDIYINIYNVQW